MNLHVASRAGLRLRRIFFVLVAAFTTVFSTLGQLPAQVFASSGNANLHLSKTVSTATLKPQLALTLGVDRTSAIPGDNLTYTATLRNTGATLRAEGDYTAQNTGATTATVLSYFDDVATATNSHCGTSITNQGNDTSQWTPLAGWAQALPGYTPVVPSPIVGSMTLTVTPVPASGVTYPSSGDPIVGTDLSPNATASWHYVAVLQLTPQQVNLLLNPQVAHVRNTLHAEMGQRTQQGNGQAASVDTDFCEQFENSAPSGAATDATITITPQNFASPLIFNASTTPALASIASGASVSVSGTARVPVPAAKGTTESDAQYTARLAGVNGSTLDAIATASATSSGGTISAPQATSPSTTVHLPILGIVKSGPATADAGTTATYPLSLSNDGGATASGLTITDTVPDGSTGTVSGVPSSLAAGATASATASFAIPAAQGPGPLTDTASVTWQDANGDLYGPVSGLYTTTITSSLAGATLTLSPTAAGPDPVGSTQGFTATLVDRNGVPLSGKSVDFAVTGANAVTGFGTTDPNGVATFSYSGSNDGNDTVQGTVTQDSVIVTSNTATVGWISPVAEISTTTVQGNFYQEPTSQGSFVAKPTDTPDFGQSFPTINFDPPAKSVNGMPPGLVDPTTRPFTDVTTDALGNFNGTLVAQGNGFQAGRGLETGFDAVLTADFVVDKPGDITFNIVADDGFMLGIGGGASRVNGTYEGAPASNTSPFHGYPLVGAFNQAGGSAPQTFPVTVHFPTSGTFPYEIDYFECCGSDLSLTMTVVKVIQDTSPISVYVGYADGLRPAGSIFPFPWNGSPNVTFRGCTSCTYDGGAIRIDNSSSQPATVNSVTVDIAPAPGVSYCPGSTHYDIWPHDLTIPAGQTLILGPMADAGNGCGYVPTFDTSDTSFYCGPDTGVIPQVTVNVNGATTTYPDRGQVLNTGGRDLACNGNESTAWTRIAGGGTTINTPLPPAVTLAVTPALVNGAVVGSTQTFTVTALDGSGQPVASLPVTLGVFGANTQQLNGVTDASGHVQLGYVGANAGTDTVTATAFISGLRAASNQGTISWAIPAPTSSSGPTGTSSGTQPPSISALTPTGGTVIAMPTPVRATVTPAAGTSISSWSVTLQDVTGGTPITLASGSGAPPSPLATIDPSTLGSGTFTLTVSATSSGGGTATLSDTVSTGAGGGTTAQAPPSITAATPADGTVVTKPVPITATFTPPAGETIASWKVTYQALDPESPVTLASGTGTPPATLATFDPTALPNDTYAITVSATASGGGTQSTTSTVAVTGNMKLGRYVTTYQDLNVPVDGFAMQVQRSYDSFNKNSGDFGVGWKLNLANFRTSANRQLGAGGWSEQPTQCFFGLCFYGFTTSTPHYVTVTWPDGHQEQFDFTPSGGAVLFYYQGTAAFTARPGTTSTLAVDGDNTVINGFDGNLYDSSFNIFNPTRFVLTTRDGRVLHLDTTLGLVSESDPSGNTLTVDSTGVHASSGPSITFARDSANRITSMTGPSGQSLQYTYSGAGDLATVTDADGNVTTYDYDASHDLLGVTGPGSQPLDTLHYDSSGRLTSVTDGTGATVSVGSQVGAQQQVVTDPTGKVTVLTYDDRGDVISRSEIAGGVTSTHSYTYDAVGRLLQSTDPLGRVFTASYDAAGNLIKTTDPTGASTSYTYNSLGEPLTSTDAMGNITTLAYDSVGRLTSVLEPTGGTRTYTYDSAGNRTSETDQRGQVTGYAYDANGNLTSRTDPLGNVTHLAYDSSGRMTSVSDPLGGTTHLGYDGNGNLVSSTDALGGQTTFSYDSLGRKVSQTDTLGRVTHYAYDAAGNLTSTTDPTGAVTAYTYDGMAKQLSMTDPTGAVARFTYDGLGRNTGDVDPLGRTTTMSYDAAGEMVQRVLPGGSTYTETYDGAGRLATTTDPAGGVTSYGYDAAGDLVTQVDALGNATHHTYDAMGRRTATKDPLGRQTTFAYDFAGDLISMTDPLGETTAYGYDGLRRQVSVTDPTGRVTTATYDPAGRQVATSTNSGHTTTQAYDADGRLTSVTLPSGISTTDAYDAAGELTSVSDQLGHTTTYTYDPAGRRVTATDPLGHTTRYGYDADGRTVSITDPLGGVATKAYDAAGQITSFTDADHHSTALSYDALGDLTRTVDPLGAATSYGYDSLGRMVSTTDARGKVTTDQYDAGSNLVSRTAPEGTDAFTYDAAGRRTGFTDPTGTTTFSYDAADRMTGTSSPEGAVSYTYDAAGRRTGMTLPQSRSVAYAYDSDGLLSTVTDWNGNAVGYNHDADGRITSITRPDGVTTSYGYDGAGRLTSVHHDHGSTPVAHFDYTLDAAGQRTATASASGKEAYSYDASGRLVGVTYGDNSTASYTYDAAGNRLTATAGGVTTGYAYDGGGQLTSVGTAAVIHDADGNVTGIGADSFAWDSASRLTSATVGGTQTTATYDADGQRVASTVASTTSPYLLDRADGLPQVVSDGSSAYVRGAGGALLSQTPNGGAASYVLGDGLGSTRAIADGTGAVAGTTDYDVYGAVRVQSGATSPFGFTGALTQNGGLLDLGARVADPSLGGFLSRDSLLDSGGGTVGFNRYAYAGDNPVNRVDPTGHQAFDLAETLTIDATLEAVLSALGTAIRFAIGLAALALLAICLTDAVVCPRPTFGNPNNTTTANPPTTAPLSPADIANLVKAATAAAAACLASGGVSAVTGIGKNNPCNLLPNNVFVSGYDVYQASAHDKTAIFSKNKPAYLTRGGNVPDGWYRNVKPCAGNVTSVSGLQCDEYPFKSTWQGGPGLGDLQLISASDNTRQGGFLGGFYTKCGILPGPIAGSSNAFVVDPLGAPMTVGLCKGT